MGLFGGPVRVALGGNPGIDEGGGSRFGQNDLGIGRLGLDVLAGSVKGPTGSVSGHPVSC